MKKNLLFMPFILLLMVFTLAVSCKDDPEETCGQDEICEAKSVTACCTDGVCVYKYNDKEYKESELAQLAIDLGCSTAVTGLDGKSTGLGNDLEAVQSRLQVLMDKVKAQCAIN